MTFKFGKKKPSNLRWPEFYKCYGNLKLFVELTRSHLLAVYGTQYLAPPLN
jgi:hypothetical protein